MLTHPIIIIIGRTFTLILHNRVIIRVKIHMGGIPFGTAPFDHTADPLIRLGVVLHKGSKRNVFVRNIFKLDVSKVLFGKKLPPFIVGRCIAIVSDFTDG